MFKTNRLRCRYSSNGTIYSLSLLHYHYYALAYEKKKNRTLYLCNTVSFTELHISSVTFHIRHLQFLFMFLLITNRCPQFFYVVGILNCNFDSATQSVPVNAGRRSTATEFFNLWKFANICVQAKKVSY